MACLKYLVPSVIFESAVSRNNERSQKCYTRYIRFHTGDDGTWTINNKEEINVSLQ